MKHTAPSLLAMLLALFLSTGISVDSRAADAKSDETYVLVRFQSNWKGNEKFSYPALKVFTLNDKGRGGKKFKLRSNSDVQLIKFKPGAHKFKFVSVANARFPFPEGYTFDIEPGKINYIGDLRIDVEVTRTMVVITKLEATDNSLATIAEIEALKPEIMSGQVPVISIAKFD